tara:strand:+ start:281 stop:676 length:396 start_codon:yes stop_codon:yes gene_type:complete
MTEAEMNNLSHEHTTHKIQYKLKTVENNYLNIEDYVTMDLLASNKYYKINISLKKNIYYNKISDAFLISVINNKIFYNKQPTQKYLLDMQMKNYYSFYIDNKKQQELNVIILLESGDSKYLELEKQFILYY